MIKGWLKNMRTSIKKMISLGLQKEDIKAELRLNNEQYERYQAQGRFFEINLPELLEKYNTDKVIDARDRERAELFNKLFEISNIETPNLDIKQKSEMLEAFPHFLDDIGKKIAEQEIQKLEEEIEGIKEQINNICLKYNIDVKYPKFQKEQVLDDIKEQTKGKTNIFGEPMEETNVEKKLAFRMGNGISVQNSTYKFGAKSCLFRISKKDIINLEKDDIIEISQGPVTHKYKVVKKTITDKVSYIKAELQD